MVTTHCPGDAKTLICKQVSKLPPPICDWQQTCVQPRCAHYHDGECHKADRCSASAPCPFDNKELLLVETDVLDHDVALPSEIPIQPWLATAVAPRKG